jgi:hypothetical protein
LSDAMNSGTAAVNRFNNAIGQVSTTFGQDLLAYGTPAINKLAEALEFGANHAELFSSAIDALLARRSHCEGAGAAITFGKAIGSFALQGGKGTLAMELFGKQIAITTAQMGKLAAQAALSYGAALVIGEAIRSLQGWWSARYVNQSMHLMSRSRS